MKCDGYYYIPLTILTMLTKRIKLNKIDEY